jgi:hypothetical protein
MVISNSKELRGVIVHGKEVEKIVAASSTSCQGDYKINSFHKLNFSIFADLKII